MSVDQADRTLRDRRAAIEDELRERLARDAGAAGPAAAVALLCLACRGISSGDAHFCKHCGVQFNAIVVAQASSASSGGTTCS